MQAKTPAPAPKQAPAKAAKEVEPASKKAALKGMPYADQVKALEPGAAWVFDRAWP